MKHLPRVTVFALMTLVGTSVSFAAGETPRVQVSLGTSVLSPGDVVRLPDTQVADTSSPVVLTIANEGDGALELPAADPPELSGDGEFQFFLDTSETAGSVEPGGRTSLSVVFFPSASGRADAVLTITTNDPADPLFKLTVSGDALEPTD